MTEPEKITIIEGPAPAFENSIEPWVFALAEGPLLKRVVRCVLRTFNGPGLVERCQNAWRDNREIYLDYRDPSGLRSQALIIAARCDAIDEGQLLQLWLRLDSMLEEAEINDGDADIDPDDIEGPFDQ
jgi:hypothetical protein